MTWAWTDTSRADTGSSHDDELGIDRQGARDADALALSAREFVRIAAQVLGRAGRPSPAARRTRSSRAFGPAPAVDQQRLRR